MTAPDNEKLRLAPVGEAVRLRDCAPGPFLFNGSIGFKTEYGRIIGKDIGGGQVEWSMTNQPDVYVLESGEAFWGGTDNSSDRDDLIVQPLAAAPQPEMQESEREAIARIAASMNLVLLGGWDEEQGCDWGSKSDDTKLDRLDDLVGELSAALLRPSAPTPMGGQHGLATDFPPDDVLACTDDAPAPVAGEVEGHFVPGNVWKCEGEGEDGEDIWKSEVQTMGGHGVIASVWGESEQEAARRRDLIFAALTAGAEPRATDAGELEPRGPITHDVKCWPGPFDARAAGLKPWELRANDRDYRVGDTLRQRRFDPDRQEFTGEVDERPITWALYGPAFGLSAGQVIMTLGDDALRPAAPDADKPEPRDEGEAEPVAWRMVLPDGSLSSLQSQPFHEGFAKMMTADLGCRVEPLYAHPPKPDDRLSVAVERIRELEVEREADAVAWRRDAYERQQAHTQAEAKLAMVVEALKEIKRLSNQGDRARGIAIRALRQIGEGSANG